MTDGQQICCYRWSACWERFEVTRTKLWTNSTIKLFESSSGCFPILILNSTSAPFILCTLFWRLHHLKGWRQPCLKIIWYGPRSLVSLSQMCVVCVAQFSTCLKLPVVDVALTKAQFKCNIAQRRWQCQMMSDLLSKINHRQTSLPGKLEN